MTLLDFQFVLGRRNIRPNIRPPHFASKVSYSAGAAGLRRMFAQRYLLLCHNRHAIW